MYARDRVNVAFASLFSDLIDADGTTLPTALFDGIHIDATFLKLAIDRATAALRDAGLDALCSAFSPWRIRQRYAIQNLSAGIRPIFAPDTNLGVCLKDLPTGNCNVILESAEAAMVIDLGAEYLLKMIEVHFPERPKNRDVAVSVTSSDIEASLQHFMAEDLSQTGPLVFFPNALTSGRFVTIRQAGRIELDTVRVLGRTFERR
ncbi:hypothetical protein QA644_14370 [Rhizobium sp. CC1099]|nr:hypothetical protein [Rhizobium sp. CC1099]WFU86317.1 hypothetical protein QA644_14370 [Rhizobium sp. CC1099]